MDLYDYNFKKKIKYSFTSHTPFPDGHVYPCYTPGIIKNFELRIMN